MFECTDQTLADGPHALSHITHAPMGSIGEAVEADLQNGASMLFGSMPRASEQVQQLGMVKV